ncbi:hypothetical protein NDI54_13830 [Haloarcula sp. S1AR25-5A]|uniref:DUF998 domain-containing protein n=1 Tax=Haloarcula terrestris TaxID=2950533 RepID=A0AAE4JHE5_9EURY|nr:hypothetical protein [Haloarcula terrestris]MDS0222423.1 hypothetical protein [Haloarcula terrestris]
MARRLHRAAGLLLALSAVCLVIVVLPLDLWPAPQPGDSYVFDPPLFSAIWVQRTLVPALTVIANILGLIGLSVLFRRDSESMSRLQRVFAFAGLVGGGTCVLGTLLFTSAGPNDIGTELTALLVLGLSFVLICWGLIGWGVGYLRSESLRLGAALAGTPVVIGVYLGLSIAGITIPSGGGVLLIIPPSITALVVGFDLWVDDDTSDHG